MVQDFLIAWDRWQNEDGWDNPQWDVVCREVEQLRREEAQLAADAADAIADKGQDE